MTEQPFRCAPLPQACTTHVRQAAADAAANPEQDIVSVYCECHRSVITANCGKTTDGERVIYGWSLAGPMNEEQAIEYLARAADEIGATAVVNRGSEKVN